AADARGVPADGIPHLALVGRSNVGKSSLINALTGTRLARTSAAPGKTRLANLYRLQVDGGPGGPGRWSVYLADLPGYGYARGGQASVAELAQIAESYFSLAGVEGFEDVEGEHLKRLPSHSSDFGGKHFKGLPSNSTPSSPSSEKRYRIAGVFHLVDSRHPGLEADLEAGAWLDTIGVNRTVLA